MERHRAALLLNAKFAYYGCRQYHQSRHFYTAAPYIVVLYQAWAKKHQQADNNLFIYWFNVGHVFDFDEAYIKRADDEAIERFAMHVGNDTDLARRERYPKMTCQIALDCVISENTRRILQRLFGSVVFTPEPYHVG